MKYYVSEESSIGTREEQQDSYYSCVSESSMLAVVCDGMGGTAGGGAASKIAVSKLKELYKIKSANENVPGFFLRTIDILDESIVNFQKKSFETREAGTTIVAAIIEKNNLYWLSVGDSRLYIIRGNEIVQATRDHNFALSMEQLTETERQEGLNEPARHNFDALISFIGVSGVKIYDINETAFSLQYGDKILLTTDGLTKILTNNEIFSILQNSSLETLIKIATQKATGSQDNTTCILIQIQKEEEY